MDKLYSFLEKEKLLINEDRIFITNEKIGSGTFGNVFVADMDFEKYAAKVMKDGRKRIKEITTEIMLHRKIQKQSQHVVKIIGVILADEIVIVMELATCNLSDLLWDQIKKARYFRTDISINYMTQICSALAICHREGFSHYDVKITNILYFKELNILKLADFGGSSEDDIPAGITQEYCPPEVFTSKQSFGPKYDVFSFGYLFLQIYLTGFFYWKYDDFFNEQKKPFSMFDFLTKRKRNRTYDDFDPMIEICRKCLAIKKEDRYVDCQEVLADLLTK